MNNEVEQEWNYIMDRDCYKCIDGTVNVETS